MKKKSSLLLLAFLPLLTSCPPSLDGTVFDVENFAHYSDVIQFDLADGLDLTVSYGLYNYKFGYKGDSSTDKYMFLVATVTDNDPAKDEWESVYEVPGPVNQHYWKEGENGNGMTFNSEAKIHIDSKFFGPDRDVLEIRLARVRYYSPFKDAYARKELDSPQGSVDYQYFFYYIDENQTVSLAYNDKYLPNHSSSEEETSSEEQSSSMEEVFSTEEPLESSEVEI